jgi:hypothetical protein
LRLNERAVGVVLGLVHLEDGVTHHRADDVGVAARRERLAVAEHRLHRVEAERRVHVGEHEARGHALLERHDVADVAEVLFEEGARGACQGEERVRILDDPDSCAAIEVFERVVFLFGRQQVVGRHQLLFHRGERLRERGGRL